jgi:L-alanine-DL-glutamate epimerase-like enolase superfamily enzyme
MGKDRDQSLQEAVAVSTSISGRSVLEYKSISSDIRKLCPENSAVLCGFETAMVDALTRARGIPLWEMWGNAEVRSHQTDITLPIGTVDETIRMAERWYQWGFRVFKVKTGNQVSQDALRVHALSESFSDISLVIDANQAYSFDEAVSIAETLETLECPVIVFEQPLSRHDLEGLKALRQRTSIPIATDESVFTIDDARKVAAMDAADVVNLKIMKSGLLQTVEIARFCQASGLKLMIGGMVESRIAMGCSFSLVLGLGGIEILDLDTPLLMAEDPVIGGYKYNGDRLEIWKAPGLGLEPKQIGSDGESAKNGRR